MYFVPTNLFQHSVYSVSKISYEKKNVSQDILNKCLYTSSYSSKSEWICKTCHKYINNNKVPPMSRQMDLCLLTYRNN